MKEEIVLTLYEAEEKAKKNKTNKEINKMAYWELEKFLEKETGIEHTIINEN